MYFDDGHELSHVLTAYFWASSCLCGCFWNRRWSVFFYISLFICFIFFGEITVLLIMLFWSRDKFAHSSLFVRNCRLGQVHKRQWYCVFVPWSRVPCGSLHLWQVTLLSLLEIRPCWMSFQLNFLFSIGFVTEKAGNNISAFFYTAFCFFIAVLIVMLLTIINLCEKCCSNKANKNNEQSTVDDKEVNVNLLNQV